MAKGPCGGERHIGQLYDGEDIVGRVESMGDKMVGRCGDKTE